MPKWWIAFGAVAALFLLDEWAFYMWRQLNPGEQLLGARTMPLSGGFGLKYPMNLRTKLETNRNYPLR